MPIRPDTDDLIAYLDSLAKLDPEFMGFIVGYRTECNPAIAQHPSVQVSDIPDIGTHAGFLGIINGYAGTFDDGPRKGWGPISAIVEGDGTVSGFERTKNEAE